MVEFHPIDRYCIVCFVVVVVVVVFGCCFFVFLGCGVTFGNIGF